MINLSMFKRQHKEIGEILLKIKDLIKEGVEKNASEIAKNINLLSGKLKIHLESEDKYLYPVLLNSKDNNLQNITKKYISEMGNICDLFTVYKNKYNIKIKIMENPFVFKKDTDSLFKALEKRVGKEEAELYPLIKWFSEDDT